jgi:hypothetical protein
VFGVEKRQVNDHLAGLRLDAGDLEPAGVLVRVTGAPLDPQLITITAYQGTLRVSVSAMGNGDFRRVGPTPGERGLFLTGSLTKGCSAIISALMDTGRSCGVISASR